MSINLLTEWNQMGPVFEVLPTSPVRTCSTQPTSSNWLEVRDMNLLEVEESVTEVRTNGDKGQRG